MKFVKNLILMSALSFLIASSAFAKTVPITTINFNGTSLMQVKKAAVKKAAVKKAAVKKVAIKKIAVKKVSVVKAPANKSIASYQPLKSAPSVSPALTPIETKNEIKRLDLGDLDVAKLTPLEAKDEIYIPVLINSDLIKWTALDINIDIGRYAYMNYRDYYDDDYKGYGNDKPSSVPVPAAVWLLGSALIGFVSLSKRRNI